VSARAGTIEFRTHSGVRGLSIALRRRQAVRARNDSPPVLFVHGATFPSALAADFPFGGISWMQTLAARGHDVWALDFLGYGRSDRYPEMACPDAAGGALGISTEAVLQIASAVAFVKAQTEAARVAIVAHSWGCTPGASFAADNREIVERLVMFGPIVTRAGTSKHGPEQSFWDVSPEFQRDRWICAGGQPLVDPSDQESWLERYLSSDVTRRLAPSVRVPYGPMADIERMSNGVDLYDPASIRVPTLIVLGEWDTVTTAEDALRLFGRLTHAPERQLTLLDRGTHLMHLESGRHRLYAAVAAFLDKAQEGPVP
jgi:pimeloyl-ACP methyl ester carboxylesterase